MFGLESLFGGGGGGSSMSSGGIGNSKSANETTNLDGRVAGGNQSSNSSTIVSGDGNTLTLTDAGAVSGSLQLAMAGITQANENVAATIGAQRALLKDALGTQAEQQSAFTSAIEKIKTADVRVLIIVGLVVVGLAGAVFLSKKGHA